ncbi:kinase-like protein [Lindgomyces ingoldianus]|uniref:Kinase-like protein n=1 Tax=Lindgomyces ingoldianus TaxID=673940 RepID=A0ACB6QS29_9PLEO|nr:kinase-like protein [Lindgomyces ingoldianus]KAF2469818.1 kinase-like protein [Lindgomyces ingoldianus]
MPLLGGLQSLRLRNLQTAPAEFMSMATVPYSSGNGFMDALKHKPPPHSQHPDFANLTLLVFEAVLEVVCVSLPGYIVARMGMFDAEAQKFVANLNVQLFTPCLIFTKLASQLSADKLVELAVIPFIFVVMTLVSYISALLVSRVCSFQKRASNFLIAMAVFGNSNSLPISLVISLSKTLSGLHWDRIPGDNDNEVAARGILYLLIFQQLGQLVRWTWGFNVLLAPPEAYKDEDAGRNSTIERGDYSDDEAERLLHDDSHSDYESGNITPEHRRTYAASYSSSSSSSDSDSIIQRENALSSPEVLPTPSNGNAVLKGPGNIIGNGDVPRTNGYIVPYKPDSVPRGPKGWWVRLSRAVKRRIQSVSGGVARISRRAFFALPQWLQWVLSRVYSFTTSFLHGCWEFMNPPLWAMLVAIVIGSVPRLQHAFFDPGTFLSNSVTRAISQSGGVAVPLILVVLGANLARNTLPKEDQHSLEDAAIEKKLVYASLISRMLIPTVIMAPLLAITAKFVPISILDDPIFVIVCFLLTGAPSALQLAQICQINNVYMGAMSKLLFQSYRLVTAMASLNGPPETARQSLSPGNSRCDTMEGGMSPRSAATKVVSIAEPESISPSIKGKHKEFDQNYSLDLDKATKQFRASVSGKRLSGRPSIERLGSSHRGNTSLSSIKSEDSDLSNASPQSQHPHDNLIKQLSAWLKQEKARRVARKAKRRAAKDAPQDTDTSARTLPGPSDDTSSQGRRASESSEGSVALEQLESLLHRSLSTKSPEDSPRRHRISHGHRLSAMLKRHSAVSSDTDYFDGVEQLVPTCEAILDNSKTLAYSGGGAESSEEVATPGKPGKNTPKEKEAWATFKFEIVRLAHTLKLKGWRRVQLDRSGDIEVERLSGALTNAVYVVSPPRNLPSQGENPSALPTPKNPPPKLLLRIYGPQVEHLIDREAELQILQRLARKRIGPRLLGTFTNGRFEEFFHAITLTPQDLRVPDTSKQIAKRMRELHEGINLLPKERDDGPFVWRNWDKWVRRCEQIVTWLDQQILEGKQGSVRSSADTWKQRGLICGVEWPVFRKTIEKYRKWLVEQYGGQQKVNERLVFAHNDTQYGNILRLIPAGESPLLLPANEHKQLVVIDFEYANANLPGLEFANHFTEWCYNYHDPVAPYRCNTPYYPTPEEQQRFIGAYLMHNPTFKAPGGSASNPPTPYLGPLPTSSSTTALAATATATPSSSISTFMLDSRAPPGDKYSYQEQEALAEKQREEETKRLMAETRLWRLANSAQWVAWGIVQAHVPGLPDFDAIEKQQDGENLEIDTIGGQLESATLETRVQAEAENKNEKDVNADPPSPAEGSSEAEAEDEEFDYLGYAQERAMFVWGDAIRLGIIKAEELPEEVRSNVKVVEY